MRFEGFKLIARKGNDYYFAQSVFKHDTFQGVTGCVVRPVSKGEYAWASDPENVAERYQEVFEESFPIDTCCNCRKNPENGCAHCNIPSFDDWVSDLIKFDGIDHLMFDNSYKDEALSVFEELCLDAVTTDCVSAGRIFNETGTIWTWSGYNDFDHIYDIDAFYAIVGVEICSGDVEKAAAYIFKEFDNNERSNNQSN